MKFPIPPQDIAIAGLRALKSIALADGEISQLEHDYIEAIQKHVLQNTASLDELQTIDAAELAELVPDPLFRERIVRGTMILALMDTEVSPQEEELIKAYVQALNTNQASFASLKNFAKQRMTLLKIDIVRRAFIGKRLQLQVQQRGFQGLKEVAQTVMGKELPHLRDKYLALEAKPKGSLGRAYWEFTKDSQFSFPGEVGGPPEPLVFHDCVHVLADYGTSIPEEARVVAFQGGFQNYEPLQTLLFVIAQFHLGIQISPVAGAKKLGVSDIESVVRSFMLGTQCNRDLSDGWDPWDDFDESVDALRERYNILLRPEGRPIASTT